MKFYPTNDFFTKSEIISSNNLFTDIYPLSYGKQQCEPLYSFGPAVREYYLLHYCVDGQGVFFANDCKYEIERGQGFLICPNDLTFYQADKENPWFYIWIAVGGNAVEKYLKLMELSRETPIFSYSNPEVLLSYIDDMILHHTLSYSNEMYTEGVLMKMFSCLIDEASDSLGRSKQFHDVYVSKAISYIETHYQEPISVQDIADYLSLNRSYLTELFLKTVHLSPQQFLVKFRITKAETLLLSTDLPIKTIAYSCGYSNEFSFSKAFKKVMKDSPGHYRKIQREEK